MSSEIIIYQTEDGNTKIQTRLENETVWLTQEQISVLFQRDRSVITKHIGNIFKEGELEEKSNVQNLHISGKVSHQKALEKAHAEYEKFKEQHKNELSQVEKDFIKKIEHTAKQLNNKKN